MGDIVKDAVQGLPKYMYAILAVACGLAIAGFMLPPRGEIHPSVLKVIALLLGGGWLFSISVNLPKYIEAGASVRLQHGETSVSVSTGKDNDK